MPRESARERIENLWDRATPVAPLLSAYRAEVLREVADLLEQGLIKEPCGEAEEHLNNCYRDDIRRLRRMAAEAP
jgi:hypothetical protein